jgi:starch synthase
VRVLYVSTEIAPALKTGGLADVNSALPKALIALGVDVRLLLPAFPAIGRAATGQQRVAGFTPALGAPECTILRALIGTVTAYLIEAPGFYAREGNPYVDEYGRDWPDNHLRFALLGWVAARFADGTVEAWRPDIVHGHDWHSGLAPAYLAARAGRRPASLLTVHNLAYQGQFPADTFPSLGLPARFFATEGVEFHGRVNFMKAGLHYSDRITTVSPTYAREIETPQHGFGMDGVLRARAGVLSGILNGVDRDEWDPAHDLHIAAFYDRANLDGKLRCKAALRRRLRISARAAGPLFGVVSRFTEQKGLDWILGVIPQLVARGGQLAVLGSGERGLEEGFRAAARRFPRTVAVRLRYDEPLAHRIIAGADVIIVPSRFEPCGLTQMYGLAYGTLPLVRRVGGLADTVHDADPRGIAARTATGFVFDEPSAEGLARALERVFALWDDPREWARVRGTAMQQDFSWMSSARLYLDLYRGLQPRA